MRGHPADGEPLGGMRTLLSLLTRGLGLLALVGLGALLLYGLVLGVQIATYESADDADHVERKRRYLAELAASRNRTPRAAPHPARPRAAGNGAPPVRLA